MTDVVTLTVAAWMRWRAALLIAFVVVALAGCSVPADPATAESAPAQGTTVVLRFGDHTAAATLADTPPARQLAAKLPLIVHLQDVWGQAKSGRLPYALTVEGSVPIHDPTPGDIYFWAQSEVIAIYYDDLGQSVPDPGLVRLGVIITGLDSLANAGKHVTVRIDLATATERPPRRDSRVEHVRRYTGATSPITSIDSNVC